MGELKVRSRFRHGTLVGQVVFRCAYTLEETMKRFLIVGAVSVFVRSCSAERFVRRAHSWMNVRTALKMRPGTSTAVPVQMAFAPSDLPVR